MTTHKPIQTMQVLHEILTERWRQIFDEEWTPEHDDEHDCGEMARAASAYCHSSVFGSRKNNVPSLWPWHKKWWKPTTTRRDLVKAGALIVAEIERLDRANIESRGGKA